MFLNLWGKTSNKNKILQDHIRYKKKKGYRLPKDWITSKEVDKILTPICVEQSYKEKKYSKIETFYREYEHLPYPIIVDKNGYLLDGFLVWLFAKNNDIKRVPTIILENVEVKTENN